VKSINTFIAIVVALIIVLFAVSNRDQVIVQVWPLPYQISLGLYAVILWAVLIGFVAGIIVAWIMGAARRRDLRESRRRIRDLEQSLGRHQPPPSNSANN
jgi:lipopolysaccharide assembly protein A